MKWYEFRQNNSGGTFEVDDMVCKHVMIEANDHKEANRIAIDMGIYFDGCSAGVDCNCCGDRWDEASENDEITFPYKYTRYDKPPLIIKTVEEYAKHATDDAFIAKMNTEPNFRIYYADGQTVKEIFTTKKMHKATCAKGE